MSHSALKLLAAAAIACPTYAIAMEVFV